MEVMEDGEELVAGIDGIVNLGGLVESLKKKYHVKKKKSAKNKNEFKTDTAGIFRRFIFLNYNFMDFII